MNFEATHMSFTKNEMYCVEMLEDEETTRDRSLEEEVLINEFMRSDPFKKYDAIGLGTYVIYDEDQCNVPVFHPAVT